MSEDQIQDPKRAERIEKIKEQYKKDMKGRPSARPMGYIFPNRIKSVLNGESPSISVSMYNPETDTEKVVRKPGDTWQDDDGNVWIQHEGWLEKVSKMAQIREELGLTMFSVKKCSKCGNKITTNLDRKFFTLRQQCFDCVVKEETRLKIIGKYAEYESRIMINNALSFFKDAKQELEHYIETTTGEDTYFNDDGTQQKWVGASKHAKEFFQKELIDVNDEIKRLEEELKKLDDSIASTEPENKG